jgi:cytochrome c-type biogenesis protein CcmF
VAERLGNILLHVGFLVAFYSVTIAIVGARTKKWHLVQSARNAVWALWFLVASCSGLLVTLLLTGKYGVKYVYQYSNSTMPTFYKVASLWGGQEGSILFWLFILMSYSSLVMWSNRRSNPELQPYIIATLMTIALFFLTLLVFEANPFALLPFTPADGRGLNPLLQNYYMIIHPPSLYLGYVGMSIPFAYAIAALITGRLDNQWVLQIRRWTLTAWFFLSMGNLLGASWAYEVLGWGGYWGWDPVENAAFMPWLSATAFLHSVVIQEKRGILKTWNMVLVVLSFLFTLTGTFLTRSGIISSVHSFAQSDIGTYFLSFVCFTTAISVGLILFRLKELRSKNQLDSMLSRESAFLFNNLVLVGAAFAILWGTLFPVLSEWVRGTKITVGPPFFNSVMIPIGLILLLLTGIGPMVAWRKTTPEQLRQNFLIPVAVTVITSVLGYIFVSHDVYVVLSFSFCAFVLTTIFIEYQRGIAVRKRTLGEDFITALLRLVGNNKRRYGGYIVHAGIVLLFVGFTGNAFKIESDSQIKVGETVSVGKYQVRYDNLTSTEDAHSERVYANLSVYKGGQPYAVVRPSRIFYKSHVEGEPPQPYTAISIKRSLREDFYTALLSFDTNTQTAFIKLVVNPLVQFVWIGGLFLILGTVVVMSPSSKKKMAQTVARAAAVALVLFCAMPATSWAALSEPEISKKLKCLCGCNFPDLHSCTCSEWAQPAKDEIRARIARGEDEATILKYFVGRDGEKVLTVPVQQGFNRTAWVVPILALSGGLLAVGLIVRTWAKKEKGDEGSKEPTPPAPLAKDDPYLKKIDEELYG